MLPLGSVYHNSKILYNFSLTLLVDREISGGGSVNRNREKTYYFNEQAWGWVGMCCWDLGTLTLYQS